MQITLTEIKSHERINGKQGQKSLSILSMAPHVREERGIAIEDDATERRTVLRRKGPEHIDVSCGRNR